MIVNFTDENQLKLKTLGRNNYEVNGQISISDDGRVSEITHQRGQMMSPCWTGCALNFHTHPPDYQTLYPDHPSTTDFKYIHTATCTLKELSAHLVVTPKFLYVLYYKCKNPFLQFYDFFTINRRIDMVFKSASDYWDRSTEDFRLLYLERMQKLGFHVERFAWGQKISFRVPNHKSQIGRKAIFLTILFGLVYFFLIKKNIVQRK